MYRHNMGKHIDKVSKWLSLIKLKPVNIFFFNNWELITCHNCFAINHFLSVEQLKKNSNNNNNNKNNNNNTRRIFEER